jgi:chemotaxis protein methyltransferase CheR
VRLMTDAEFARFRLLIERETGIHMSDAKRALLVSRFGRQLRRLGLQTYTQYYDVVTSGSGEEKQTFIDAICTNETRFFREPRQFEFLRNECIPLWRQQAEEGQRSRHLRIWSTACSTGEEPYSLAMVLTDLVPAAERWDVRIVATDLSTRALEAARTGVWSISRSKDIPHEYLHRFMLRGVCGRNGTMTAGLEIRTPITFGRLNLASDYSDLGMRFDAIFCRNVLIYFDGQGRAEVVKRLLHHLVPGGYLFLGHAETLNGMDGVPRSAVPNVYVK